MNTPILWNGRHLQAARVMAGLTQRTLAERAGTHVNACKYWERKTSVVCGHAAERFKAALAESGIDVSVERTRAVLRA